MASVRLHNLSKAYAGRWAVRDLDLHVAHGEYAVLIGPSGCGKTTTLRLLAGLDVPSAGRIELNGVDVTATAPQQRNIGMVFQSPALYPHMTVRQNLQFRPLRYTSSAMNDLATQTAHLLGIEDLLERMPGQLSGGERQRVAVGRALVRQPALLLLDEPLSNLDANLRRETQQLLARVHRQLGLTTIHVTHDQDEALALADRLLVMHSGKIQQVGTPLEVYRRPANAVVAEFLQLTNRPET